MIDKVRKIAKILYDKKAQNIIALDVKDLTVIADYMVIATGRNTIAVRALVDELEEKMAEAGFHPVHRDGHQDGRWAVLDYGGILVHIFHGEEREYYRLDKLWERDGNLVDLQLEEED